MKSAAFTGERIIPELDNYFFYEHLARYRFARQYVGPDTRLLDIGCGDGYGTFYLAAHVKEALGIDIDAEPIRHANEKYRLANLSYRQVLPNDWQLPPDSVDVATCFEVFEHVQEPDQLIARISGVLRKGGIAILSTPNKDVYGENLPDPYHVKEYSLNEFRDIVGTHLTIRQVVGQRNRDQAAKRRNFWMARQAMRFPILLRPLNWMLRWKPKKYLAPGYFDQIDLRGNYFSPDDADNADYFVIVAEKPSEESAS